MTITPEMQLQAENLVARFTYVSDSKRRGMSDHWEIPTRRAEKIFGDCDDAMLHMAAELFDYDRDRIVQAFKDGTLKAHRVKTGSDAGHAVLEFNGAYFCNIGKRWRDDRLLRDSWKYDKRRSWTSILWKLMQSRLGGRRGIVVGGVLLALAVALLASQALGQTVQCNTRAEVERVLAERYSETRRMWALAGNGALVETWASETGTWTITVSQPGGLTCVLASGTGWAMVAESSGVKG
jgi:hypothetical protein